MWYIILMLGISNGLIVEFNGMYRLILKLRWTLTFKNKFTPISTPKWHKTIWFYIELYASAISKNFVTIRLYGHICKYIDLWKRPLFINTKFHFDIYLPESPWYIRTSPFYKFILRPFYARFLLGGVVCWNRRIALISDSSVMWTYLSIVVFMLAWLNNCCNFIELSNMP